MAFDFHIHISENSRQGQAIQKYAQEQRITPEQAAERLLEEAALARSEASPAEQMWGAFSSPEERQMLDEIVAEAYERRIGDRPRDFGI